MSTSAVVNMQRLTKAEPDYLEELAHEINVRLQKADDHRLTVACKVGIARDFAVFCGLRRHRPT